MSVALWVAVGVTCYLMLAALGVLLCRGIATPDEAEAGTPGSTGTLPRPRSQPRVSVASRPAVR